MRPGARPGPPMADIVLMPVVGFALTLLDEVAKLLVRTYSMLTVVWGRYAFNLSLIAGFAPILGVP